MNDIDLSPHLLRVCARNASYFGVYGQGRRRAAFWMPVDNHSWGQRNIKGDERARKKVEQITDDAIAMALTMEQRVDIWVVRRGQTHYLHSVTQQGEIIQDQPAQTPTPPSSEYMSCH